MTDSRQQRILTTSTHLQSAQQHQQLVQSRSQPILNKGVSPNMGTPPPPASQSLNIPTLAVTPVISTATPNIVIEQYPTILRVVSIEEVNATTEPATSSSLPILTRASSYLGK